MQAKEVKADKDERAISLVVYEEILVSDAHLPSRRLVVEAEEEPVEERNQLGCSGVITSPYDSSAVTVLPSYIKYDDVYIFFVVL